MEPEIRVLAREAYERYTATTDNKNYQGLPCPTFDDLTPKIKEAWEAAVKPMLGRRRLEGLAKDAMFMLKDLENGDYQDTIGSNQLAFLICDALGLKWLEVKAR